VIDAATLTVIKTVGVGRGPYGVAVSPNGSRVYVANSYEGTVSVIDTATNSLVNTIPAGGCLTGIAVSPNNARVYVTASGTTYAYCQGGPENLVHVIDTATNAVVAAVPVEEDPMGLVVTPDGSRVYVANSGNDSVSVINTASNTVVATIGVPNHAWNVDVVPLGTHVYAYWGATVSVISTASNLIVNTVQVASVSQTLGRFIVVPLVPVIPGDGEIRRNLTADQPQTSPSQANLMRIMGTCCGITLPN
jgi:YVTN family beta-propeller protein